MSIGELYAAARMPLIQDSLLEGNIMWMQETYPHPEFPNVSIGYRIYALCETDKGTIESFFIGDRAVITDLMQKAGTTDLVERARNQFRRKIAEMIGETVKMGPIRRIIEILPYPEKKAGAA